jgi:glycerophosphoryl diester phosphodiesterase
MTFIRCASVMLSLALFACGDSPPATSQEFDDKIVIAHRGASGYLPEHTIASKAMAYAQGVDFIEQDLVMTRDDEVIVLHDHLLDTVSNVRDLYPDRARADGSFYVVDFTLDEIRRLAAYERFEFGGGKMKAVFADRFPIAASTFRIHTLAEEIELIQGLNRSTGNMVGIYPEIKSPAFHREEGKDISVAVLSVLKEYGYTSHSGDVYLQCFDSYELLRIYDELLPAAEMDLPLVQLIGESPEYEPMLSAEGMQRVSGYAVGIGPPMSLLVDANSTESALKVGDLISWAHASNLKVHAYTFRQEHGEIPAYATSLENLLEVFFVDVGIDGVFTDFPDQAVEYLESRF